MLAVIGADGNLSVYDADGRHPIRITTDAAPGQRLYQWPTWANDGRLAFFGASADPANPYMLRAFVVEAVTAQPAIETAFSSVDDVFTYAYWSPADRKTGPAAARDLALLYTPSTSTGLGLRLITDQAGRFSDKIIGQSAPFYYSFAPDGTQMIWFQAGDSLLIYDLAADSILRQLPDKPGKFQARMWSPRDDRLLFGVESANPDQTDLVIAHGSDRQVLLAAQDAPIAFAWSPDAAYVASVAGYGNVVVTDAQSGKTIATSAAGDVVAHFWSPASDRVAFLVVNRGSSGAQARLRANGHTPAEQAAGGLTWHILDLKSGEDRTFATFSPTREMVYMLNFADQFARSHSLWSPDGRYLTYAATDVIGKPSVWLVDTRATPPVAPQKVAGGSIGVWSWR